MKPTLRGWAGLNETSPNPSSRETRMRTLNAANKAQVAADYNALPHDRITEHKGTAEVFTAKLAHLVAWYIALGGRITRQPVEEGVTFWALHTDTDHGNGAPVRVYALSLDSDQIDADIADAVA
jgi:hypothetical protein